MTNSQVVLCVHPFYQTPLTPKDEKKKIVKQSEKGQKHVEREKCQERYWVPM